MTGLLLSLTKQLRGLHDHTTVVHCMFLQVCAETLATGYNGLKDN